MRRSLGTLVSLASLLAMPLTTDARGSQGQLRVTTYGVRFDVLVTSDGRPVSGLRAEDFEVVDAGVLQHVDTALAVSHVAVAFVLDTSASTHVPGFERFARAGDALVGSLGADDLAALVTCSDHLSLAVPLTGDRDLLRRAMAASTRFNTGSVPRSPVWDAIFGAAGLVARDSGRPLVVLISDGVDNASWLSRAEIGRRLAEANLVIDFVQSEARPAFESPDGPPPGPIQPEDVAKATDGEIYNIADTKLAQRFATHLNELRQAYVLTYQPRGVKTDGRWHAVKVRVRGRSVNVKARPGYYANRVSR